MQIDNAKKQQAIAHINELASKHKVFYNLLLHCHKDFLDLANEMGIKVSKLYPDEEKKKANLEKSKDILMPIVSMRKMTAFNKCIIYCHYHYRVFIAIFLLFLF